APVRMLRPVPARLAHLDCADMPLRARASRRMRLLFLVVLEQIAQGAALHLLEPLRQDLQARHAVGAEVAEILSQFAVSGHRPAGAPEEQPERPDGPLAGGPAAVDIAEADLAPLAQGGPQFLQPLRDRSRNVHGRSE